MQLVLPEKIDDKQVARYLGYPDSISPDSATRKLIDAACIQVLAVAHPREIHRLASIDLLQPLLSGADIFAHLEGCGQCMVIAVTLGTQVDMLLRRTQAVDMATAVIMDAAASALVEQVADAAQDIIRQEIAGGGLYMTGRFSPGYGDYFIGAQNRLLAFLDAARKIGLFATDTHILTPRKSITALCGVAQKPVAGRLAGCAHCTLRETCNFRKEGKLCAQ